jgi:hypothetical protein
VKHTKSTNSRAQTYLWGPGRKPDPLLSANPYSIVKERKSCLPVTANQRKIRANKATAPTKPAMRKNTVARITHLFGETTLNPKPFGVKFALRECVSALSCFVLVAAVPVAFVGFSVIYLTSRLVHKLTGKYPVNVTLRLGEDAEAHNPADSAA